MIEKYLWITGSGVLLLLGIIHLFYTFFTSKFSSGNKHVVEEMKTSFPVLTKQTTMWKAWIGFNASYSIGAIFIGLVNTYLAFQHMPSWLHRFSCSVLLLSLFCFISGWQSDTGFAFHLPAYS